MEKSQEGPQGPPPLAVHVDLSRQEHWHRREWERLLSTAPSYELRIVDEEKRADCVLSADSPWQFGPARSFWGYTCPADSIRRFVWDSGDLPTGYESGMYCSLPRTLFDHRRHRAICYPINYNECITAYDLSDASKLFGFVGAITSGLRARMINNLQLHDRADEMLVAVQSGPWGAMFDRSGLAVKREYANALRQCRFFLCPRGNGVGTIRLFETMKAARVPVILSDDFVLPDGIDWNGCSIRVAERNVADVPMILRERMGDWADLATNARRNWEDNFSDERLLSRVAQNLRELMAHAPPLSIAARLRILSYPRYSKIRSGLTRIRQTIKL